MVNKLKVLCPDCGNICIPEVIFEKFQDPVDFRGEDRILVDDVDIRLTINCSKCGRQNIFMETSGPLFFNWVGP